MRPSTRPFALGGRRCSLHSIFQHFLDIPRLISLVLDSTDWTLLKINGVEGQEVNGVCVKIAFRSVFSHVL